MKSKLEAAAQEMLVAVDTSDLLYRGQCAMYKLQSAVVDPWFSCDVLPEVPEGVSRVEVLGAVNDNDADVGGYGSIHIVSFWKSYKGLENVWTLELTSEATGEPYDALVSVNPWHPIPARGVKGG